MERDRDPEVDWIAAELARSRASERAPEELRRTIVAWADAGPRGAAGLRRRRAAVPRRDGPRRPRRRLPEAALRSGPRPLAGLVGLAMALVVALLLLTLGPGGRPGPTVAEAAAALPHAAGWSGSVSGPRPATARAYHHLAGVQFPAVLGRPGWRTTGTRTVFVSGRALDVSGYLARAGRVTVTYAVTAGPVLAGQSRGYSTFRAGGRTVVSWQEAGHSCLLASPDLSAARLLAIARS